MCQLFFHDLLQSVYNDFPVLCIQVLVWQNSKSELNYNELEIRARRRKRQREDPRCQADDVGSFMT